MKLVAELVPPRLAVDQGAAGDHDELVGLPHGCIVMLAQIEQAVATPFDTEQTRESEIDDSQGQIAQKVVPLNVEKALEIASTDARSASREWQTRMFIGPVYKGGVSHSADIYWGATFLCRLVYAGPTQTLPALHAGLAARALNWIASYESRSGRTLLTWVAPGIDPLYTSIS